VGAGYRLSSHRLIVSRLIVSRLIVSCPSPSSPHDDKSPNTPTFSPEAWSKTQADVPLLSAVTSPQQSRRRHSPDKPVTNAAGVTLEALELGKRCSTGNATVSSRTARASVDVRSSSRIGATISACNEYLIMSVNNDKKQPSGDYQACACVCVLAFRIFRFDSAQVIWKVANF
jgi:hypothetical protein